MGDDVLGLRSILSSNNKDKNLISAENASVNQKPKADSGRSQDSKNGPKLSLQNEMLTHVKVVYNPKEAEWLNDSDVIPVAPCGDTSDEDEVDISNSRWEWTPIQNSSRLRDKDKLEDDLTLYHWKNSNKDPHRDYKFSCFDEKLQILRYTDEEYEQYLQHPEWTRDQTDTLFALCEEYDLRFLIVHDRYNPSPLSQSEDNSLQDVKEEIVKSDQLESVVNTQDASSVPHMNGQSDQNPGSQNMEVENKSDLIKPKQEAQEGTGDSTSDLKHPYDGVVNGVSVDRKGVTDKDTAMTPMQISSSEQGISIPKSISSGVSGMAFGQEGDGDNENGLHILKDRRTVEELKDRFYSIQRALLRIRNGRDPDLKKHPMMKHEYDMEYESHRRLQLDLLQRRTHSQELKIASTVIAARRLNKRIKMIKRSLSEKNGLRIRAGGHVEKDKPSNSVITLKRNVIPKHRLPPPEASSSSNSRNKIATGRRINKFGKGILEAKAAPSDMDVFQEMEEEREIKLAPIPEKVIAKDVIPELKPGVTLRSNQVSLAPTLPGRSLKTLENELVSINLALKKPRPFVVPTNEVCKLYNQLRVDIVTLINMRKHIQKKEHERDALKSMLRAHNKVGPGTPFDFKKEKRKFGDASGSSSFKRRKMSKNPKFST